MRLSSAERSAARGSLGCVLAMVVMECVGRMRKKKRFVLQILDIWYHVMSSRG